MILDRWIPFRNDDERIRFRLFVFPHAAGSAALYRPLRRVMPPQIDLCPLEPPGRAARLNEPPCTSMNELMDALDQVLPPLMTVPYGFFGHSVGAWAAYQAAQQLRSTDGRTAAHLFVSGRRSPDRASTAPIALPRSDDDLLAILRHFGGTPASIMKRPDLIASLLATLRADLALVDEYSVRPGSRVACPITAFAGSDDIPHCGSLQSWADFTGREFRTCIFPGGHFYFFSAEGRLANEIARDLWSFTTTNAGVTE